MKKVIGICLFALFMVMGTQSATAQNSLSVEKRTEINALAIKKAKLVRQQTKLESSKIEDLYLVFQRYETMVHDLGDVSNNETIEVREKATTYLNTQMKTILGEEKFEIFKDLRLE